MKTIDKTKLVPRVVVPKAENTSYKRFAIKNFPAVIAGDIHMPYHDRDAVAAMLDHVEKIGAKTLVFAGDCLDCYSLSRWIKDPRKRNFKAEIEMMRDFLASIRKAYPDMDIIYKEGNHEERLEHYLQQNAPALFGLDEITIPSLLNLDEQNIAWVGNKRVITAKKLNIIHGHEYVFSMQNPVNPARGLYLRAKKSAMCFHFHQTSEHSERAINDDMATCWSVGCLCNLSPEYMPLNKWNHGFADITIDGDQWNVHNYRIREGRVL